MMRRTRQLHRSIGIVCEGTKTENVYIFKLFEHNPALDRVQRHIIPKEVVEPRVVRANEKRPKRALKGSELFMYHELSESNYIDYNRYKSQPLRYVREAYLLKEEENCNEVWAIFDKDFHPGHKRAFEYAERWGVNIAFNSLSFEQWVLLHYEKSIRTFNLVQCKTHGRTRRCGYHTLCKDQGNECLCGYLRRSHISDYSKSDDQLYGRLLPLVGHAVENAAWLRFQYQSTSDKIYKFNPYCNMDRLVLRLLNIDSTHIFPVEWFALQQLLELSEGLLVEVEVDDGRALVTLRNDGFRAQMLHPNSIYTSKEYGLFRHNYDLKVVVEPNEQVVITIENSALCPYLNIVYNNVRYLCSLRVCEE